MAHAAAYPRKAIWDPIQLAAKFSNPAVVILGLVTVLIAMVSTNVAATVVGAVLAGGAYSTPGNGPLPGGGLIPLLKPLYDYSWAVGFAAGFLIYLALAMPSAARSGARMSPAMAAGQ